MIGTYKEKDKSSYTPKKAIKALTKSVQQDFQAGWNIQHQSFREFNDMNVISRLNKDQDDFNIFEDDVSKDPDKKWRSTSVSPIARNKVISIAAHILVSLMFPNVYGRNEDGEPEQDAADAMEQAGAMAERFHRMYLRNLRAMRDYRRYNGPVLVQNAGQVNVGGQHVNIAPQG